MLLLYFFFYLAGGQTTEVTAKNTASTESNITDNSQVTSATALTLLSGTNVLKKVSDFRFVIPHYFKIMIELISDC